MVSLCVLLEDQTKSDSLVLQVWGLGTGPLTTLFRKQQQKSQLQLRVTAYQSLPKRLVYVEVMKATRKPLTAR